MLSQLLQSDSAEYPDAEAQDRFGVLQEVNQAKIGKCSYPINSYEAEFLKNNENGWRKKEVSQGIQTANPILAPAQRVSHGDNNQENAQQAYIVSELLAID